MDGNESCKCCGKSCASKVFLKHIAQSKKCKASYGDEFERLKTRKLIERDKNYKSKNRSKINQSQSVRDKKNAVVKRKWQKDYYDTNAEVKIEWQKKYNEEHSDEIKVKKARYYQQNSIALRQRQSIYNRIHRIDINQKKKERVRKQKAKCTSKDRFLMFKQEIQHGPTFVCMSCYRCLFERGVKVLDNEQIEQLEEDAGTSFLREDILVEELKDECMIFCHSCLAKIRKKKKPRIHISNGLWFDEIPPELELTELEQQLISKSIVFMKIKKLPKSRMNAIIDRVINIPVEDQDIVKTVTSLPRPPDEAMVIGVTLKRKLEMKNGHLEAFIRPHALFAALRKLKALGNKHYANVEINLDFMKKHDTVDKDADDDSDCSDESDGFDNDDILDAVKKGQSYHDSHTCLVPTNPEEDIVENDQNSVLYKKLRESGRSFPIAPGENKRPSNWCREEDFEVKAWPNLFPSGKYGLNHDREEEITPQLYFNQRLLNCDPRCSQNIPYLFMAQQLTETLTLEKQMDISGQMGIMSGNSNAVEVKLKDPFSVFKKMKGTPAYWQVARNELIAKVKQLGPFHVFFTISCAEMKWSEVFVAILRSRGEKVEFIEDENGWNGKDENIIVNDKDQLWDYVDAMDCSRHELLKDHVFLITRMFDERIKSFIKNILMGPGEDKAPFKFYSYRVEIQARGNNSLFFDAFETLL